MRKPQFTALKDAPAEGDALVLTVTALQEGSFPTVQSVILLGPGRDYHDREAAFAAMRAYSTGGLIKVEVSGVYATISALVADYPAAKLDPTARRMLAAEQAREQYTLAVAEWRGWLAAHGLEPCERCGGEGGWRGWPGFTCYRCGGAGTEPTDDAATTRQEAVTASPGIGPNYVAEHARANEGRECEGHPAGPLDPMGVTVYCDGSCNG